MHFRVNYDTKNWDLIIDTMMKNHTAIHEVNRAQLVDDALNLARAGLIDYEIALGLTNHLGREFDYIPWKGALRGKLKKRPRPIQNLWGV